MIDKQYFKEKLTPIMNENNIYLEFIGIYDKSNTELFSICFEKNDSTFNINYVNSFCKIESLKNKVLGDQKQLGKLKCIFSVYEDFSFNVEKIDDYIILIILKPEFENFAFLRYIRNEIHTIINKSKE